MEEQLAERPGIARGHGHHANRGHESSRERNGDQIVVEHVLGMAVHPAQIVLLVAATPLGHALPGDQVGADLHVHAAQESRSAERRDQGHSEKAPGHRQGEGGGLRRVEDEGGLWIEIPRRACAGQGFHLGAERRDEGLVDHGGSRLAATRGPAEATQRRIEGLGRGQLGGDARGQHPGHVLREADLVQVRQRVMTEAFVPGLGRDDPLPALVGEPIGRPVGRVGAADAVSVEHADHRPKVGQQERRLGAIRGSPRVQEARAPGQVQDGEGENRNPGPAHLA